MKPQVQSLMSIDWMYSHLSSADMEVRRKAMSIVLSMTSSRNVEEVALFLKKQLQKTQEADYDKVCSVPLPMLLKFVSNTLMRTRPRSIGNSSFSPFT